MRARAALLLVAAWATAACASVPIHPWDDAAPLTTAPVRFDPSTTTVTGAVSDSVAAQIAAHTATSLNTIIAAKNDAPVAPTTVAIAGRFDVGNRVLALFTTTLPSGAQVVSPIVLRREPEVRGEGLATLLQPDPPARDVASAKPQRVDGAYDPVASRVAVMASTELLKLVIGGAALAVLVVGVGLVGLAGTSPAALIFAAAIGGALVVVAALGVAAFVWGHAFKQEVEWSNAYAAALRLHGARVAAATVRPPPRPSL